jgi:Big-like domain-containing protein/PKD domain-containing protein
MILHTRRRGSAIRIGSALVTFMMLLAATACDKVPLLAPSGSRISLFAEQDAVPLNGTTNISATVLESSGTPVQNGTLITFTTTLGSIEPREARTNNGTVTVRFRAGNQSGVAVISAFSGGASSGGGTTTTATSTSTPTGPTGAGLQIRVGAAVVDTVQLVASPANVASTGGTVQLIATVIDANGNRVAGVPVTFTTTVGQLSAQSATTDDAGQARVSLTTTREAKVNARAGAKVSPDVTISVNPVPAVNVTPATQTVSVSQPAALTVAPPANGALTNARINFGDGQTQPLPNPLTSSVSVNHVYCSPNGFTVSVTGTDLNGESASGGASVIVTGLSITVAASPASAAVRQSVSFTVGNIPAGAIISRFEWDFGDGQRDTTTGASNAHSYQNPGPYNVRVTAASSQCGSLSSATTGINITP